MSTLEEKIKVMQAFGKGKPLISMHKLTREVVTAGNPDWNWGAFEYFVVGPEKPRRKTSPKITFTEKPIPPKRKEEL